MNRVHQILFLNRKTLGFSIGLIAIVFGALGMTAPKSDMPRHEDMVTAAQKFLEALGPGLGARAVFPFESEERFKWHFVPNEMFKRSGVSIKEMTYDQRKAAHALLRSALSSQGYLKATSIMQLEAVLREIEDRAGTRRFDRDPELYWFRIFGTPSNDSPWGWSVSGHHLSLNFSSVTNELTATTPLFTGSNPAHVLEGPYTGLRILAAEEDLARALLASLDESQRAKAILSPTAPKDILTENARRLNLEAPTGLPVSEMNENQRSLLMRLIAEYIQNLRRDLAHAKLEKIKKAGIEKIYFAWAGSTEPGKEHYYRVQGPNLLIEYDNTQNNANHIHAVLRDPEDDFGEDLLRKHYAESEHHKKNQ
ncbi:MAG TPA: DUF3500 domain-containing protein [Candidatus Limnocylindrales bacterium]|nr:DUF3500 domain-containing protein [Candidatus Limnocylindrales bacterium]